MSKSTLLTSAPSAKEVDQVVSYVQAVLDLSVSPLFAEGQPLPRPQVIIELDGGETLWFHLPDTYVLRSALIPFRRIWMQEEPSNFDKVRTTLTRHFPESIRWYFKFLKDHYLRSKSSDQAWKLSRLRKSRNPEEKPVPAVEIVNRGLYLDLFHCDSKRATNSDSSDLYAELGPARFEYMFSMSVYDIAMHSTVLMEAAQFFLNELDLAGELKSLRLAQLISADDQEYPDRTYVRRYSPGYTPDPRTPGEKLAILRRENAFIALNSMISLLRIDNDELARAILGSSSLSLFLKQLGYELSDKFPSLGGDDLGEVRPPRNGACGSAVKGKDMWTGEPSVVEAQLCAARSAILDRKCWRPVRRELWKLAMHNMAVPFPLRRLTNESN